MVVAAVAVGGNGVLTTTTTTMTMRMMMMTTTMGMMVTPAAVAPIVIALVFQAPFNLLLLQLQPRTPLIHLVGHTQETRVEESLREQLESVAHELQHLRFDKEKIAQERSLVEESVAARTSAERVEMEKIDEERSKVARGARGSSSVELWWGRS